MNKQDYIDQRQALVDEANALLKDSKPDEANAKVAEIEALDQQWQDTCTVVANLKALEGSAPTQDPADPGETTDTKVTDDVLDEKKVESVEITKNDERTEEAMAFEMIKTPEDAWKSDVYETAWAKSLMGKPLTEDENKAYRMVNEDFVHTTENTGSVIPNTIANGIWSEVEDLYPYYADITKTNVSGLLTIVKATESTEAAWYDEDTETEQGKETFETIQLAGCELSRAISVSWKLKEMAIADFIPYITRRMAEAMGAALGYGVVQGKGADADKPEPMGIVTALEADGNQVVSGDIDYDNITAARAKIKSGYGSGVVVYADSETIWGKLANVKDGNGRPLFIHDAATEGGVFRILGMVVKEDASVPTGKLLLSNASRGYQANVNRQVTVATEDHARQRITDYVGYAIVDGAPLTLKAHALISGE